jgi:hypothetical protein
MRERLAAPRRTGFPELKPYTTVNTPDQADACGLLLADNYCVELVGTIVGPSYCGVNANAPMFVAS